jgi:hypothetical protein
LLDFFRQLKMALAMVLAFSCGFANAHEVETTRLSLVQREPTHVTATFYVNPVDFFQPVLETRLAHQAVLVYLASLDEDAFAALCFKAQSYYKAHISFKLGQDKTAHMSHWQFATGQILQNNIQQQLAQQVVNPGLHAHLEPVQMGVQLTSSAGMPTMQPQLPAHWGRVLVVASKPQQIWLENNPKTPWIKF